MATASPSSITSASPDAACSTSARWTASTASLAERRGASRVVAVDNEQYLDWVGARFGVEIAPAVGFDAIAQLTDSQVEYRQMDSFAVRDLHPSSHDNLKRRRMT